MKLTNYPENEGIMDPYEDEIDLHELLGILSKNKKTIFATFLLGTVISGGIAYQIRKAGKRAETVITFDYKGIESGKNMDGSTFNKDRILSNLAINRAYDRFNLSSEFRGNMDQFRNDFSIEGIVPSNISSLSDAAIKQGKTFDYNPTQYKISLKLKDAQKAKEVLTSTLDESLTNFKEYNIPKSTLGKLIYDEQLQKDYDFTDYITNFSSSFKALENELSDKNKGNFTSLSLGYSYKDLLIQMNNLKDIEFNNYISFIDTNRLTKNKAMLRNKYLNKIKLLEIEKDKTLASVNILKNIIKEYRPTEKQIVLPTSTDQGIKFNNVDEYYSNLIGEYKEMSLRIAAIDSESRHLEKELGDLKTPTEEQRTYLTAQTKTLVTEINKIIDRANLLNENYYAQNYSNIVKVTTPVSIVSSSKAPLIFLVGSVLSLFSGIFLAFVKEFLDEYKRKKKSNASYSR